jgi:hypothetical protein
LFRITGTLSAPNLNGISASQDTVAAAGSSDPSILRFGDGLSADATSPVYGTVAHGGPLTLATGRWTATGTGGIIQAVLSPGATFNLFPLNYAVDDGTGQFNPPPAGTVQNTFAAANVLASPIMIPEPGSIVLMALGSVGLIVVADKRA